MLTVLWRFEIQSARGVGHTKAHHFWNVCKCLDVQSAHHLPHRLCDECGPNVYECIQFQSACELLLILEPRLRPQYVHQCNELQPASDHGDRQCHLHEFDVLECFELREHRELHFHLESDEYGQYVLTVADFTQNLASWDTSLVTACSNFCAFCGLPSFTKCIPCATRVNTTENTTVCNTRAPTIAPSTVAPSTAVPTTTAPTAAPSTAVPSTQPTASPTTGPSTAVPPTTAATLTAAPTSTSGPSLAPSTAMAVSVAKADGRSTMAVLLCSLWVCLQ